MYIYIYIYDKQFVIVSSKYIHYLCFNSNIYIYF